MPSAYLSKPNITANFTLLWSYETPASPMQPMFSALGNYPNLNDYIVFGYGLPFSSSIVGLDAFTGKQNALYSFQVPIASTLLGYGRDINIDRSITFYVLTSSTIYAYSTNNQFSLSTTAYLPDTAFSGPFIDDQGNVYLCASESILGYSFQTWGYSKIFSYDTFYPCITAFPTNETLVTTYSANGAVGLYGLEDEPIPPPPPSIPIFPNLPPLDTNGTIILGTVVGLVWLLTMVGAIVAVVYLKRGGYKPIT